MYLGVNKSIKSASDPTKKPVANPHGFRNEYKYGPNKGHPQVQSLVCHLPGRTLYLNLQKSPPATNPQVPRYFNSQRTTGPKRQKHASIQFGSIGWRKLQDRTQAKAVEKKPNARAVWPGRSVIGRRSSKSWQQNFRSETADLLNRCPKQPPIDGLPRNDLASPRKGKEASPGH